MPHENSITVEMGGKFYNVSGIDGRMLQGPFDTRDDAEFRAKVRSGMQGAMRNPIGYPPGLGSLAEAMNEDYSPPVAVDEWQDPTPTEYTPPWVPADIYTARR